MAEYIISTTNMPDHILEVVAPWCNAKVVRCKDCKYYGHYDGSTWCSRTYESVPSGTCDYQTVEPDGFCKWGEMP